MAHFLLSLVLLTNAIVLHRRAGQPDGPAHPVVAPVIVLMGRLLVLAATVVVTTGTVVTGAGPHSGGGENDRVERLDLSIPDAARVHGTSVIVFLLLVLLTVWLARQRGAPPGVMTRLSVLLAVLVAQAAVGYAQYFNDIPAVLVGVHIAGATAVWAAVISLYVGLFERTEAPADADAARARPILAGAAPTLG
jgi:cytochrome c oxidase assembly protein subunit 15